MSELIIRSEAVYVSDAWFDRYVTEIIIRREYLDDATLALLESEPVELDPWQPLTKRCR